MHPYDNYEGRNMNEKPDLYYNNNLNMNVENKEMKKEGNSFEIVYNSNVNNDFNNNNNPNANIGSTYSIPGFNEVQNQNQQNIGQPAGNNTNNNQVFYD
jgi:hypothetical protein